MWTSKKTCNDCAHTKGRQSNIRLNWEKNSEKGKDRTMWGKVKENKSSTTERRHSKDDRDKENKQTIRRIIDTEGKI